MRAYDHAADTPPPPPPGALPHHPSTSITQDIAHPGRQLMSAKFTKSPTARTVAPALTSVRLSFCADARRPERAVHQRMCLRARDRQQGGKRTLVRDVRAAREPMLHCTNTVLAPSVSLCTDIARAHLPAPVSVVLHFPPSCRRARYLGNNNDALWIEEVIEGACVNDGRLP